MIRSLHREWHRLSGLLRIGLLVFVTGSGLDLVYHGAPPVWTPFLDAHLGADGYRGHLAIMTGMALIALGLIVEGARQRSHQEKKEARSEILP